MDYRPVPDTGSEERAAAAQNRVDGVIVSQHHHDHIRTGEHLVGIRRDLNAGSAQRGSPGGRPVPHHQGRAGAGKA